MFLMSLCEKSPHSCGKAVNRFTILDTVCVSAGVKWKTKTKDERVSSAEPVWFVRSSICVPSNNRIKDGVCGIS